jgi:hypothetical protein
MAMAIIDSVLPLILVKQLEQSRKYWTRVKVTATKALNYRKNV